MIWTVVCLIRGTFCTGKKATSGQVLKEEAPSKRAGFLWFLRNCATSFCPFQADRSVQTSPLYPRVWREGVTYGRVLNNEQRKAYHEENGLSTALQNSDQITWENTLLWPIGVSTLVISRGSTREKKSPPMLKLGHWWSPLKGDLVWVHNHS